VAQNVEKKSKDAMFRKKSSDTEEDIQEDSSLVQGWQLGQSKGEKHCVRIKKRNA
jgi:hypothetical protein